MALSTSNWTDELPPVAACGLIPKLPPLALLREQAEAAVNIRGPSASTSVSPGTQFFYSQPLFDAMHRCVMSESDIPKKHKLAVSLLISSVAMEDYVRSHSTKARIIASQHARAARAAKQQVAEIKASNDVEDAANLLKYFLEVGKSGIVDKLIDILGEPDSQRCYLSMIVHKHDAKNLVEILQATKRAFDAGDTKRADGNGNRTLGGMFLREEKRFKASAHLNQVQRVLPPLPPLRSYQRDMVAMVLLSWGMTLPSELLEQPAARDAGGLEEGEIEAEDSEAALRARWERMTGGWSSNWLVSAPTNSGKTRMFVEVARGVINSKSTGRRAVIVVLVPSVILTTQHAAAFLSGQLPATLIGAYSSDNQLSCKAWREVCMSAHNGGHASVVVATAESFNNLLRLGKAMIAEVDLLVLDEAHHCKDDHPYAQVIAAYNSAPKGLGRPKLLGVTASPASERDLAALDRRMTDILGRLSAKLHVVDGAHPDVAVVLPEPKLVEMRVEMRPVDREMMLLLQTFALHVALAIVEALARVKAQGLTAQRDKVLLEETLLTAISTCESASSNQYLVTRLDTLGQWLARGREFACRYGSRNLDLCCRLLDVLRKGIELVEDAGFEGVLPFLARKAVVLCRDELAMHGGIGAGGLLVSRPRTVPPCPAATDIRKAMFSVANEAAAATSKVSGASALKGRGNGQVNVGERGLLSSLEVAAKMMPSPLAVAASLEAGRAAANSAQPGNSCPDMPLLVSELLQKMLLPVEEGGVLTSSELVADCFVCGELTEELTFPKFWALMSYLQRYKDKPDFHGIIFVRTRQAVFHVTDLIRRTAQLQFMEVLELIGHNNSSKRTGLAPEQDRHGRGMNDNQQQQVLQVFKEAGRKVLVATSAAEEGLDVPSCEFVVRYNAAATGIQLLQSRGRARQRVAEFCAILQDCTLDTELHAKSRQEEANMHKWQRTFMDLNEN